jgi:Ni2+-binding GTPase involved in maturation of urease and hydrogenase
MAKDAARQRGERPVLFTNLKTRVGVDEAVEWIRRDLLFES